tara:strand:- start:541 stop:858 length:318 start_codon:yes stop_codon:yes gene_type:complete
MFCPKCGSILMPKKDDNKKTLMCSCGYKTNKFEGMKIKDAAAEKQKEIEVIEKSELETLPKAKVICPKCGHTEAYFWLMQTRAGDEPETKFLKCVKCRHTWRDYD